MKSKKKESIPKEFDNYLKEKEHHLVYPNIKAVNYAEENYASFTDPLGEYTGVPLDKDDLYPVQDADDL